ncbi:MAG: DUF1501 domain-containing protein, partial [Planctomycetota bacterium]|nr:DUF1501 domain-containing protein [Planctomycetota bacterium]
MDPFLEDPLTVTRRQFFCRSSQGLGAVALASLLSPELFAGLLAGERRGPGERVGGIPGLPHFRPRARRVIYLCQSGAPSQIDLFDHKPRLRDWRDQDLPASVRKGQRLTSMTAAQARFPIVPSIFRFARRGASGAWVSELLPETAAIADGLCFIKSMVTEAINHDPAITFLQTGPQLAGRPSMGAWIAYGLGSDNRDLPAFVALTSGEGGQPLY